MSSVMSPIVRRLTAASPTPAKLATFLRHLEDSGSVSVAARRTGIARNTVYQRRKADPAFALGWQRAVDMAVEALRDAAIAHARDGTERVLWRGGRQVGTIREYDNRLLMFLLRTLKPEVFGRPPALTNCLTGPRFGHESKSCSALSGKFRTRDWCRWEIRRIVDASANTWPNRIGTTRVRKIVCRWSMPGGQRRTNRTTSDNRGQRRTVGVLSGVPERPGLRAFFTD